MISLIDNMNIKLYKNKTVYLEFYLAPFSKENSR